MSLSVKVGARSSLLSRAQVGEVLNELRVFHPNVSFDPAWLHTSGDLDLTTSLRTQEKTDFFTRQIDMQQLQGAFQISIHSVKDLPEPLAQGLRIVAITKGVDPSDVIVTLKDLPFGARIGTSSLRREQNIKALRSDLVCVDIRGTIEKRLELLDQNCYDGVVMAEAALIRLGLTYRNRIHLPGECAQGQGQLAVVARESDKEMAALFACIDTR